MNPIKLSILIPSLACRPVYLIRLLTILEPQIKKNVEVLISIDNADKQIGTKRNELLQRATGDYIVFIDDDDLISQNYVEEVLKATERGVDYISYPQIFHFTDQKKKNTVLSELHQKNDFDNATQTYRRGLQHICPIKRSLAIQFKFPDKSFSEDTDWATQVDKIASTQYNIIEPMYFYEYRQNKQHETTNGFKT